MVYLPRKINALTITLALLDCRFLPSGNTAVGTPDSDLLWSLGVNEIPITHSEILGASGSSHKPRNITRGPGQATAKLTVSVP